MGLPINKFIASANINDVVPEFLKTGNFITRPSVSTISNAMDVGNPSNFIRIQELYNYSWQDIKKHLVGYSFSDKQTKDCITAVYNNDDYTLDPHGAVAYLGLSEYMKENDVTGVFLETAHPAKFNETVEKQIPVKVEIPENLQKSLLKEKQSVEIGNSLKDLKDILLA